MDDSTKAEQARRWGLCATCGHANVVANDRGSTFLQCGRAKDDPNYRRYPPVPVVRCDGHETRQDGAPDLKVRGSIR